jgi:CheY-like chemotaxis protein
VVQRCLIVDDSRAFLSSARALLESQGMTVTACAASSEEALAVAERAKPQLALVDVELAGEDGFRVGGWVRRVRIHLEDRAQPPSDRGAVG